MRAREWFVALPFCISVVVVPTLLLFLAKARHLRQADLK